MAAATIAVLGGASAFVWGVDPLNRYRDAGFEESAASAFVEIWHSGAHAITLKPNHDERRFFRATLPALHPPPKALVFGSSRIMEVGADVLGEGTLNAGMSGGTFEDFAALSMLGDVPRLVVIGIDPWSFNANSGQTRWGNLLAEYVAFRAAAGLPPDPRADTLPPRPRNTVGDLLSFQSLRNAVIVARSVVQNAPLTVVAQPPGPPEFFLKLSDGTIRYPSDVEQRDQAIVAKTARGFGIGGGYGMLRFVGIDPEAERLIEAVIAKYVDRGAYVVLVLVPYHPDAYSTLSVTGPGNLLFIEDYTRTLAQRLGVPVHGSYDPARAGCTATEFTDGLHPKRDCVRRLFAKLNPVLQNLGGTPK